MQDQPDGVLSSKDAGWERGSAVSFAVMPDCQWVRYDVSLGEEWVISDALL